MHRSLVVLLILEAIVLLVLLWPSPPAPEPEPAPPTLIGIAGGALDEDACAGPALRELTRHPNWAFTFAEREATDVVTSDPDEILQTVMLDAHAGTWRDGDLPQSLELDPAERGELLAAAERSCLQIRKGDGYTAHYVTVSYGTVPEVGGRHDGRVDRYELGLAPGSRAAIDVIAVMDRVRARYVAARIATADAMTLTLRGPRRTDTNTWTPYAITIRPDGRVVDKHGDGCGERLEPAAHVDLLDWAMQLPATASGPRPLTGSLEIAGTRRPVAVQLDAVMHELGDMNGVRTVLWSWWVDNVRMGD
ncbi:MAG TPA: hypothetical protein VHW23_12035 [Kofleriaceae bacterium]|jgi:hypothetical protein|nr:hypothetical protein [Kofleriaceae bacterium]